MKRTIALIVCTLFLVSAAGPSFAVEKKDKDKKTAVQSKEKPSASKTASVTPKSDSAKAVAAAAPKKYDTFIDANKNGIDDRKEKLVPKAAAVKKTAAKKAPTKAATAKKTSSDAKDKNKK